VQLEFDANLSFGETTASPTHPSPVSGERDKIKIKIRYYFINPKGEIS